MSFDHLVEGFATRVVMPVAHHYDHASRLIGLTAHQLHTIADITEKYARGVADITTVLNTERTLFQAQDSFAQARLAHMQAVVALYKALGGGWNGQV